MKKYLLSLIISTSLLIVFCEGCSNKQKKEPPIFVKADTTTVLKLIDEYFQHIQNKEYEQAVGMLYKIDTPDSIKDLKEEEKAKIIKELEAFPVLSYRVSEMKFIEADRVRVTYVTEFFKKRPGNSIPNTLSYSFAPERINGKWYLQLMERSEVK